MAGRPGEDEADEHRFQLAHVPGELDRVYLSRLFRDSRGDLETMAKALGIKVSNVYHWLKRVGLDIRSLRQDS